MAWHWFVAKERIIYIPHPVFPKALDLCIFKLGTIELNFPSQKWLLYGERNFGRTRLLSGMMD